MSQLANVTDLAAARAARQHRDLTFYVAGPMRGRPLFNFPAFEHAAQQLRAAGYDVISPAEHDLDDGFDPALTLEEQDFDLREAMAWDLQQVLASDGVAVLVGWQHSAGACAEVAAARAVGIPVFDLAELVERAA